MEHKGSHAYCSIDDGKATFQASTCAGEVDGLTEGAFGKQGLENDLLNDVYVSIAITKLHCCMLHVLARSMG